MSYTNEQRLLSQKRIEKILEENLPMDKNKALSLIMYKMGMKKDTAKEYIKVLYDNEIIAMNEEGNLICNRK